MTELSTQAWENYNRLRLKAIAFQERVDRLGDGYTPIKALINDLVARQLPENPTSTEEIVERLQSIENYMAAQRLLIEATPLEVEAKEAIALTHQELLNSWQIFKASLPEWDISQRIFLDGLNSLCSNELFLDFITDCQARMWTMRLLAQERLHLNSDETKRLVEAWGEAVRTFVEDARKKSEKNGKVQPGQPETFVHFFCIRDELNILYDRFSSVIT
ncbi:hypothetical protein WA1_07165 [Scytonema hofmannii PCC 7110]|uniref:Uncharacterized protein n=1 Tax=Scytonema hofmannii PCC 7110 TaxID=128403 RepID=A0A139WT19_9CYAN|nr:hypothetical protein [Scytonema hofmannii]KYC35595.1 hypothetical protein WA1_07165 [Scytonema hofmannii PCC 7110]